MAKDAVSEHSDHDSSAQPVSERDDVSRLQEEPSRERWRAVDETPAGSNAPGPRATSGTGLAIHAARTVGIALQEDSPPPIRPRFKTLLGVPRNDPNLELYADHPLLNAALLEADAGNAAEGAALPDATPDAGRSGTAPPSKTAAVLDDRVDEAAEDLEDAAAPDVRAEPATAATDTVAPIEKLSSTVRAPREAHGQFTATTPGSFDLRDEIAALRRTGRRTGWLLAMGGMCAAAALTLYLPREWRMLPSSPASVRRDDAALLITSWQATQTLEALSPTTSSGQPAAASAAFPATTPPGIAGQEREAKGASELEQRGDATKQTKVAATPSRASSSRVASASSGASGSTERAAAPSGSSKSLRTPNAKAPRTEHSHAAPRKVMAGRGAQEQARMKALEARQNPPRNAGGSGIIRDTPF